MKLGQKKLDRYYSLTDSSAIYRIAMVLHPGMKLEYFRQNEWEEEWIEQAENMVREEYIASYEKLEVAPVDDKTNEAKTAVCHGAPHLLLPTLTRSQGHDAFTAFGDLSVATATRVSEIDDYLRLPVEKVSDPLKWWSDNRHVYPHLSGMARDYLSAPRK